MFTGIIEDLGIVKDLVIENDNLHLTIESVLAPELKIDQSVSHNGICERSNPSLLRGQSIDPKSKYAVRPLMPNLEIRSGNQQNSILSCSRKN